MPPALSRRTRRQFALTESPSDLNQVTCSVCGIPFWTRRDDRTVCSPCMVAAEAERTEDIVDVGKIG